MVFFSNAKSPLTCPANITFIPFSVDDFCRLASVKLKTDVRLSVNFLYKICDFKPAFGLIYEDYLSSYDFWGHCDVDIIWGQIKDYMTNDLLEEYDILTSRPNRISGHFCLYRNNNTINNFFIKMPSAYKSLQIVDNYEQLDEEHFSSYIKRLKKSSFLSNIKHFFLGKAFVPKVYWEKILTTSGAHQRALMSSKGSCFKWRKGRAYHIDGTEMMYLHFHILKGTALFKSCNINNFDKAFNVSNDGIQ